MTDGDKKWMQYTVELDILDQHAAHFKSDKHKAAFTLPRADWEGYFNRPGSISVRVTLPVERRSDDS